MSVQQQEGATLYIAVDTRRDGRYNNITGMEASHEEPPESPWDRPGCVYFEVTVPAEDDREKARRIADSAISAAPRDSDPAEWKRGERIAAGFWDDESAVACLRRVEAYLILGGRTRVYTGAIGGGFHGITVETTDGNHYLLPDVDGWSYFQDSYVGDDWIEHGIIASGTATDQDVAAAMDMAMRWHPGAPDTPTPGEDEGITRVAIADAVAHVTYGQSLIDLGTADAQKCQEIATATDHRLTRHGHLPLGCEVEEMSAIAHTGEPRLATMLRAVASALSEAGMDPALIDHKGEHAGLITLRSGTLVALLDHPREKTEADRWPLYVNGRRVPAFSPGACTPCAIAQSVVDSPLYV